MQYVNVLAHHGNDNSQLMNGYLTRNMTRKLYY